MMTEDLSENLSKLNVEGENNHNENENGKADHGTENHDSSRNCNLIVNYLPHDFDESTLKDLFTPFGEIASTKVVRDKYRHSVGYGFVKYKREEDAMFAIENMNGYETEGKNLKVSIARPAIQEIRNCKLYITNLPREWTETEVIDLFKQFGDIIECRVLKTEGGDMNRGVAFVQFNLKSQADNALTLNGSILPGSSKHLVVKCADDQHVRGERYGFGGRGGEHSTTGFHGGQVSPHRVSRPERMRSNTYTEPSRYYTQPPRRTRAYTDDHSGDRRQHEQQSQQQQQPSYGLQPGADTASGQMFYYPQGMPMEFMPTGTMYPTMYPYPTTTTSMQPPGLGMQPTPMMYAVMPSGMYNGMPMMNYAMSMPQPLPQPLQQSAMSTANYVGTEATAAAPVQGITPQTTTTLPALLPVGTPVGSQPLRQQQSQQQQQSYEGYTITPPYNTSTNVPTSATSPITAPLTATNLSYLQQLQQQQHFKQAQTAIPTEMDPNSVTAVLSSPIVLGKSNAVEKMHLKTTTTSNATAMNETQQSLTA